MVIFITFMEHLGWNHRQVFVRANKSEHHRLIHLACIEKEAYPCSVDRHSVLGLVEYVTRPEQQGWREGWQLEDEGQSDV